MQVAAHLRRLPPPANGPPGGTAGGVHRGAGWGSGVGTARGRGCQAGQCSGGKLGDGTVVESKGDRWGQQSYTKAYLSEVLGHSEPGPLQTPAGVCRWVLWSGWESETDIVAVSGSGQGRGSGLALPRVALWRCGADGGGCADGGWHYT